MFNLFKKKQTQEAVVMPIDKSHAREGFTSTLETLINAARCLRTDSAGENCGLYLYVIERDSENVRARFEDPSCGGIEEFTMYFWEPFLGSFYDSFLQSSVSRLFMKMNGKFMYDNYKGIYFERHFESDAEAMSAVIVLLLEEVYHLRPEDVCLRIQLLDFNRRSDDESTATFDCDGNKIASTGFQQDLF